MNTQSNKKKPIIFITNDIEKDEDWCYIDKRNKRIDRPREELIKEIKDHSDVSFWMYNLSQILYKSKKYLKSNIEKDFIESVSNQTFSDGNSDDLAKNILHYIEFINDLYSFKNYNDVDKVIFQIIECLQSLSTEIKVTIENEEFKYIVVKNENNTVLIEVVSIVSPHLLHEKTKNFLKLLTTLDIQNGIIYAPYCSNPHSFRFGSVSKIVNGKSYQVSQAFC